MIFSSPGILSLQCVTLKDNISLIDIVKYCIEISLISI